MKTILQVFLFMMSIVSFAQQGINYKALIKDGSGNVVANSNVEIIFEIIDSQNTTIIYGETHTVSTDANGIVIVNIGEGDASPGYLPFTDINWGEVNYSLKTYLNDGNETSYLGETQFKAVPYALHAYNVSGLEAINEGNGIGWRLIGRNPANYGNIGVGAIDFSHSSNTSATSGARGNWSFAVGLNATASFQGCIAMGDNAIANEYKSIAIGVQSQTLGVGSMSLGWGTLSRSVSSMSIGSYNLGLGLGTNSWLSTDPIFEVGNGRNSALRSNALTILKNGNVGIGTHTPANMLEVTGGDMQVDGSTFFVDASTNRVGIGTTAPAYPLHITTRTNPNVNPAPANPPHYFGVNGSGTSGSGWTYSIGATYGVWSGIGFSTSSDSRIKNIMGQSNSADDLSKLMKLEITDYQYIDVVNKGDEVTKKVIAQQVKEVLPNAVNYTVDFIPNIYQLVTMSKSKEGQTRLMFKEDPGVNKNYILKFITENNAEVTASVISVLGNTVIVDSELKGKDNQIFVFGKRVNDFHTVDYDAISMLNVSATQEQQKLIETLQEKVQSLQKQNQALQAEANKILALEKDMLELKTMLLTQKEQTKITQN